MTGKNHHPLRRALRSIVWPAILAIGCTPSGDLNAQSGTPAIDLQGHRGARGLLPENSIPAFLRAIDLGVDTIELDVSVTADSQVVVTHEPWFSHEICSKPDGSAIDESEARNLNIYQMTYAEVTQYDCGLLGNPRFPTQTRVAAVKPQLSAAIATAEGHEAPSGPAKLLYNVEIKSKPERDDVYHPAPERFARLVYDVLAEGGVLDRTTIQSFDPRALEEVHRIDSTVSLSLLVDNDAGFVRNLSRLSFQPDIYSPNYRLVDSVLVGQAHSMSIRVIPWTVNDEATMQALLALGVDGLITDYPDIGRRVIDAAR